MKRASTIIKTSLILIIIFLIYFFTPKIISNNSKKIIDRRVPKYHFALIVNDDDEEFWSEIIAGAKDAANHNKVVLETIVVSSYNEVLNNINMVTLAKVDGILANVIPTSEFRIEIDKAIAFQIPVITLVTDNNRSHRNSFIGTNNFILGKKAGELLGDKNKNLNLGVIIHKSDLENNYSKNVILSGLREALSKHRNSKIVEVTNSNIKHISAKQETSRLIENYPELNAIFCTNPTDGLGAALAIIDKNKVGDILLITLDYNQDIIDYIKKGVIQGAIARNSYQIGYRGVENMIIYKEERRIDQNILIEPTVINQENVYEFSK